MCILLATFCLGIPLAKSEPLAGSRPNILLVLTDDQGLGDLSCMGNPILRTPHLDQFYAQSTRFANFHVSPTCAPTRSALMSGRPPFEVGVTHTIMQRERMALDVVTFPQALQKAGYTTALFGKWHLGDEEPYLPQNRGFDEVLMHGGGGIGQYAYGDFKANIENGYFDNVLLHNDTIVKTKGFCTDLFFEAALAWMREQWQKQIPFFAYLSLNAPHSPYIAPGEYKQRFLEEGYDDDTAGRYGMIENIDDNFGQMMKQLDTWGALENTLVIFMTDNGMSMRRVLKDGEKLQPYNAGMKGTKNSPFEGGTRVPSFWYWKGMLDEGVDIHGLAAHIDLYRTFCKLAGAEIPDSKLPPRGRSLVPLLEDSGAAWPDRRLFFHVGRWNDRWNKKSRADSKSQGAAVRTPRWRWVNGTDLYDMAADPGGVTNVAAGHPEVMKELGAAFDTWWDSTEPLLANEGLPVVEPENQPLTLHFNRQKNKQGIPDWEPRSIEEISRP